MLTFPFLPPMAPHAIQSTSDAYSGKRRTRTYRCDCLGPNARLSSTIKQENLQDRRCSLHVHLSRGCHADAPCRHCDQVPFAQEEASHLNTIDALDHKMAIFDRPLISSDLISSQLALPSPAIPQSVISISPQNEARYYSRNNPGFNIEATAIRCGNRETAYILYHLL